MSNKNDDIGILDPEGKNDNPLTGLPYSDKYKELGKFWSKLPVYKKIHEIIDIVQKHQVVLIVSVTGSGKSLIMPRLMLHIFNYTGTVAMTLPKQLIAKSSAEFSSLMADVELGSYIGYQYKGSPSNAKSDKTRILYATDGTIMARVSRDPQLKDFDCIIIDEAHELSNNTILLLYLLRETIRLRPEFKLIIMSATIDTTIFINYYQDYKFKLIDVGGERLFSIESHFLDKQLDYNQAIDEGFKTLVKILESDDPKTKNAHDIIFFITSSNEAFNLCKMLHAHIAKEKTNSKCKITCDGDVYCVELYANMNPEKQTLAQDKDLYKKGSNFNRKVVIATNIAESSITFDSLKYVIDSGRELHSSFDPDTRARKLDRELISQAQAKQRMGRAGRTESGVCYHLYTKDEFNNKMKKFPSPDLIVNDISSECLKLLANENVQTIEKLTNVLTNLIETPKEAYIRVAINSLTQLGAIEKDNISNMGKLINDIPDDNLFMATAVVYGKIYNCSYELMKISAIIEACKGNISELYNMPSTLLQKKQGQVSEDQFNKQVAALNKKFDESRKKFIDKDGDHLSLLNIYEKFEIEYSKYHNNPDKLNDWAYDKFLKVNNLIKAIKNYKRNKDRMHGIKKERFDPKYLGIKHISEILNLPVTDRVLICLLFGFRLNTAAKQGRQNTYKTQFDKTDNIKINKISFLSLKDKQPSNVFYHELFASMGKSELVIVSHISKKIIKLLS